VTYPTAEDRERNLARADEVVARWKLDPGNPSLIDELMAVGGHTGGDDGRCLACGRFVNEDGIHWH